MRAIAIVTVLIAVLFGVSACGEGDSRPCLRGHNDTIYVPITNMVGNIPVTTWIYEDSFVCDEYAPASPTP